MPDAVSYHGGGTTRLSISPSSDEGAEALRDSDNQLRAPSSEVSSEGRLHPRPQSLRSDPLPYALSHNVCSSTCGRLPWGAGAHPPPPPRPLNAATRTDRCCMKGARIKAECSPSNAPLPPSILVSCVELSASGGFLSVSKEPVKSIRSSLYLRYV